MTRSDAYQARHEFRQALRDIRHGGEVYDIVDRHPFAASCQDITGLIPDHKSHQEYGKPYFKRT